MELLLERSIIKLGEISISKQNKITIYDFTYNDKGNIQTNIQELKNELLWDKL